MVADIHLRVRDVFRGIKAGGEWTAIIFESGNVGVPPNNEPLLMEFLASGHPDFGSATKVEFPVDTSMGRVVSLETA